MTATEFAILPDGRAVKRQITETDIDLNPSIEAVFQSQATFKTSGVCNFGDKLYGDAGVSLSAATPGTSWWSVRVRQLNLNCAFKVSKDMVYPDFLTKENPIQVGWVPPPGMILVLGVTLVASTATVPVYKLGKHYLIAYDTSKRVWRLPLSNLYEHCELCHGQDMAKSHPNMLLALKAALDAFAASKWNADLYGSSRIEQTSKLFRFKPTDKGFDQLPIEGAWPNLSEKVSNELINSKFMPVL